MPILLVLLWLKTFLMKHILPVLTVLTAGLCLAPASAYGQAADSSQGSRAAQQVPQTRRVIQGAAPAPGSVQQVRRRIRQIGPGGSAIRNVIYPLIIPVVPQVVVNQQGAPSAPVVVQPQSGGGQAYTPGRAPYYEAPSYEAPNYEAPYYDANRGQYYDPRTQRFTDEAPSYDAPPQPRTPPRPGVPFRPGTTVREVERAILETGLFRALGVNFEFDRSMLLPEARRTLDPVGQVMEEYPELRFEIAGHTDSRGAEAYNQQLSARRATAVRDYLVQNFGISPDRLTTRGLGESQPIASNDNATGRTLNRRVEFRLLNPGAAEQYREEEYFEPAMPADSMRSDSVGADSSSGVEVRMRGGQQRRPGSMGQQPMGRQMRRPDPSAMEQRHEALEESVREAVRDEFRRMREADSTSAGNGS